MLNDLLGKQNYKEFAISFRSIRHKMNDREWGQETGFLIALKYRNFFN